MHRATGSQSTTGTRGGLVEIAREPNPTGARIAIFGTAGQ